MAGTMFGAPEGIVAFDQNELVKARTQAELAQAASFPSEIRLRNAQAGALEQSTAAEKRLGELMMQMQAGGQPGDDSELGSLAGGTAGIPAPAKPASMADMLDKLSTMAAGAGLATKAQDLAKNAALIRSREASQLSAATTARLNQLKMIRETAGLQGQLFGGATDEASWNTANALYEFQTGMPSPYRGVQFSPALAQQINDSAMTAKERADAEEKAIKQKELDTYRKARLAQLDRQNELREAAQRTREERERRLAKAGGGSAVSSPTKSETDQAARLIRKDFSGMDAADLNDAAFNLASEARALRKQNKALDAGTALQQAYNAAVAAGDFQTDSGIGGFGFRRKTTYSGRGKTVDTPAPIPADRKQLIVDRYYVNPQGQVGRWTGKGFLVERPLSGNNRRVNAEPDTEPDDDQDEE